MTSKKHSANTLEKRIADFSYQLLELEKWYELKLDVVGNSIVIKDETDRRVADFRAPRQLTHDEMLENSFNLMAKKIHDWQISKHL